MRRVMAEQARTGDRRPAIAAAAWAVAVALAGGLLTEIGPWYRRLSKPSWQPPDWLFGPAWTTIFALSATAAARAWKAAPDEAARREVLAAYATNGALNMGWSLLFFRLRRPDWALAEVGPLWLSILWLGRQSRRRSRQDLMLLAPYLGWVAFAAVLNAEIVRRNRPFGD